MSTAADLPEVKRASNMPPPPYHHINRIQCIFMWWQSMPSKVQQSIKKCVLNSREPGEFIAQYGMFAGDITTAMALGACLKPPAYVVEESEHADFTLFFKT